MIVGACSGGFGFAAVNVAAEEQAQALSDATPDACGASDGPLYHAVCQAGRCTALETGDACGAFHEGPSEVCPADEEPYVQSCELASDGDVAIATGCHRRCGDDGAAVCPPGFACEAASACGYGYGGGGTGNGDACTQCEPFSAELCVPEPDCELLLSLDFSDRPSAAFGSDGALTLSLRAQNLTSSDVTLSIPACVPPVVEGLPGYDAFEGCAAGCEATEPRELTLLPSQRIVLASATLQRDGSPCNPDGIANGIYTLAYSQPQLTGLRVCGPAPVELRVRP